MASETIKKLQVEGWSLSAEKIEQEIPGFGNLNFKSATEEVKNSDLKNIGTPCVPDDLAKVRIERCDYYEDRPCQLPTEMTSKK